MMTQAAAQSRSVRCSPTWKLGGPRHRCGGLIRSLQRCKAGSDEPIGGLQTVFCDDFKCDSSPQVERAVRAFAKDVEKASTWTIGTFAEDVKYEVRHKFPSSAAHYGAGTVPSTVLSPPTVSTALLMPFTTHQQPPMLRETLWNISVPWQYLVVPEVDC